MITIDKLIRVLHNVTAHEGHEQVYGTIECTGGCEIAIEFTGQLRKSSHDYLLRVGFIVAPGETRYTYRPPARRLRRRRHDVGDTSSGLLRRQAE